MAEAPEEKPPVPLEFSSQPAKVPKPSGRTLGGVPFEVAGPEFYAKYGGKAFLLRPVGGAPKPPTKPDDAPPK